MLRSFMRSSSFSRSPREEEEDSPSLVQHAFLNEAALGMYLKQGRGHVFVEDVFPYMQAHQVGVQVGSVVLGIDRGSGWTDLSGMSCDQVIAQIEESPRPFTMTMRPPPGASPFSPFQELLKDATETVLAPGLLSVHQSGGQVASEPFHIFAQNLNGEQPLELVLDFADSFNLKVSDNYDRPAGSMLRVVVPAGSMTFAARLDQEKPNKHTELQWKAQWKLLEPDRRVIDAKLGQLHDSTAKDIAQMVQLHIDLLKQGKDPFALTNVSAALDASELPSFIDIFFTPLWRSIGGEEADARRLAWRRPEQFLDETVPLGVFLQTVSADDIVQGELGSGWFMCALASLVEFPEMIDSIFGEAWLALSEEHGRPMHDDQGLYELRFCMHGQWINVLIDDYLPCKGPTQGLVYSCANGPELWVSLIEKAYAKLQGSYSNIRLGLPDEGLLDLTGAPTIRLRFDEAEVSFDDLRSWDRNSCVVCADSSTDGYVDGWLLPGHAYTVLQVRQVQQGYYRGAQVLQIRNPWGRFEWGGDWSNESPQLQACRSELEDDGVESTGSNGLFWMSFNDFKLYFASVSVCALYVLQPGSTLANPQYLTSTPDLRNVGTGERYVPPRLNWRSATGRIEGERFVPRRWEEYRIKSLFETSGAAGEARLRPAHCFHLVVPTPHAMHETLMFTLSQVDDRSPLRTEEACKCSPLAPSPHRWMTARPSPPATWTSALGSIGSIAPREPSPP
jgi:hypothetical protein